MMEISKQSMESTMSSWAICSSSFGLDQGYNFSMLPIGLLGFFDGSYLISNVIRSLCLLFAFLFVVFWICTWLNKTIIPNFKNVCLYGLQLSCSSYSTSTTCFWTLFACTLSFKYQRNDGWNCFAYLAC